MPKAKILQFNLLKNSYSSLQLRMKRKKARRNVTIPLVGSVGRAVSGRRQGLLFPRLLQATSTFFHWLKEKYGKQKKKLNIEHHNCKNKRQK